MEAINIFYKGTFSKVLTPEGNTMFFDELASFLQSGTLATFIAQLY